MAPPTPTFKGVEWRFYVKAVFGGKLLALHYTRREFDPYVQDADACVYLPGTIRYEEGYEFHEDCKIDHNVVALGDSNDQWSKVVAEPLQNAVDTTLEDAGYNPIGGWGDGLKVCVAQSVREGCTFHIVVMPTSAAVQTVLSTPEPTLLVVQNVAPKAFSDLAMYVGHTDKTSASYPVSDARSQMSFLRDPAKFKTGTPINVLDAPFKGDANFCTTAVLCTKNTPCPPTSLRNAWYPMAILDVEERARASSQPCKSYRVLDSFKACMDVHVMHADNAPGIVEYYVYQNCLFVYKNRVAVTDAIPDSAELPAHGLCVIVHTTSIVSFVGGRDRRLEWHKLRNLLQPMPADAAQGLVDFCAGSAFLPGVAMLLRGVERMNCCDHLITLLNVLLDHYHLDIRERAWPTRVIPVYESQHMPIASQLAEASDAQVKYETMWTPSSYQSCFKREDLFRVASQTPPRWEEAEQAIAIVAESTNAATGDTDIGHISAFRLSLRVLDVTRLSRFGVFRKQAVTVDENNGTLAYNGQLLLPCDAEISGAYLKRTLIHLRLINPDVMERLWMAMGKNNERLQELEKMFSKRAPAAEEKGSALSRSSRTGKGARPVISPDTPLPQRFTVGEGFRFGGSGDDEAGCCFDGDYEGQASFEFVEYTWRCSTSALGRTPVVSLERRAGGDSLVCMQSQTISLVDLLRRTDFKLPSSTVFASDADEKCFAEQTVLAQTLLPETIKHINANLAKFGVMEGTFEQVPISTSVHAAAWAVGCGGYVKCHGGGIDHPLLPTNCFSASLRFVLFLQMIGYETSLMLNSVHIFAAVHHLFPGDDVTYIECTTTPAELNSLVDARQIEFMRDNMTSTPPPKRRRGNASRLDCFCAYPSCPSAQFYPDDTRTAACALCKRVFHVMCANDRVEADGTRVCLVCKPDENGCFCKQLHHFSPWVDKPFHIWISCDDCGRMMHEQCCTNAGMDSTAKGHVCGMFDTQCIACDDEPDV